MYKSYTVRVNSILERMNTIPTTKEQAIAIGDNMAAGHVWGTRYNGAIEMYRAGGLGIYQIYSRLNGHMAIEYIRQRCEQHDHDFYL